MKATGWMLRVLLLATALALLATGAAHAAQAPLNQYVVTNVSPKALAEGGYDRTEASLPGQRGKYIVVATPAKANELRGRGATVRPLHGVSRARARRPAHAKALAAPAHGYNVFRP